LKQEIIRVEPLSTYLDRWKAPTSAITAVNAVYARFFSKDPPARIFVNVPESRDPQAKHLDFIHVLTFSPALLLLVWTLIDGNNAGWSAPSILLRFSGAIILLIAFWDC
jgi:hypothetical protein